MNTGPMIKANTANPLTVKAKVDHRSIVTGKQLRFLFMTKKSVDAK